MKWLNVGGIDRDTPTLTGRPNGALMLQTPDKQAGQP